MIIILPEDVWLPRHPTIGKKHIAWITVFFLGKFLIDNLLRHAEVFCSPLLIRTLEYLQGRNLHFFQRPKRFHVLVLSGEMQFKVSPRWILKRPLITGVVHIDPV